MFIAAGLLVLLGLRGRLNDLFASAIIASMAVLFGWIDLYGDDGGFSGGGALASRLTGLPINRVMFGLGSVFCLAVVVGIPRFATEGFVISQSVEFLRRNECPRRS